MEDSKQGQNGALGAEEEAGSEGEGGTPSKKGKAEEGGSDKKKKGVPNGNIWYDKQTKIGAALSQHDGWYQTQISECRNVLSTMEAALALVTPAVEEKVHVEKKLVDNRILCMKLVLGSKRADHEEGGGFVPPDLADAKDGDPKASDTCT